MEIMQAAGTLVCTRRIEGLKQVKLRLLRNKKGKFLVSTDSVGVKEGDWVFTVSGSAARYAVGDFKILTDLTVGGIIDSWTEEDM